MTQHLNNIGERVAMPPFSLATRLSVPMNNENNLSSTSTPSLLQQSVPIPLVPPAPQPFQTPIQGTVNFQNAAASFNKPFNFGGGVNSSVQGQYLQPSGSVFSTLSPKLNNSQNNPIPLNIESLSVQPEQTMHIVPKPMPLSQIPPQQTPYNHQQAPVQLNQIPLYEVDKPAIHVANGSSPRLYASPLRSQYEAESPPPLPPPLPTVPGILNFIVYRDSIHDENIVGEIILDNKCTLSDIRVQIIKELEVEGRFLMECNGMMLNKNNESAYAVHAGCRPDNILVLNFVEQ